MKQGRKSILLEFSGGGLEATLFDHQDESFCGRKMVIIEKERCLSLSVYMLGQVKNITGVWFC